MRQPGSRRRRGFAAAPFLAAAALLAASVAPARALALHGVDVPAQAEVAGKTLTLNGAGTRYFLFFKVYVAALYLPQKAANPQAIYAMRGPKELKLTMLRDVSGKELADKLNEGIKDNLSPQEFANFIPSLAQLGGMFGQKSEIKTGETVTIREVPGTGGVIAIDGVDSGGTFTDPQFFNNMLRIWLGRDPAEQRLKNALLGQSADSN